MKDRLKEFEKKYGRLLPMNVVIDRLYFCSETAAYELIKTGELKAIRTGAKKGYMVPEKELDRFIKKRIIEKFLYE